MSDGNVIEFRRRTPEPGPDGVLACPDCGSQWFALGSFTDDDLFIGGMVCLNAEGSVDGYSGTPHCSECNREVLP